MDAAGRGGGLHGGGDSLSGRRRWLGLDSRGTTTTSGEDIVLCAILVPHLHVVVGAPGLAVSLEDIGAKFNVVALELVDCVAEHIQSVIHS